MFDLSSPRLAGILFLLFFAAIPVYGEATGATSEKDDVGGIVTLTDRCCDAYSSPRDCCDVGCRSWRVTADAIFLERSAPDSLVLMHDTGDPTRNLNADAFDFGVHTGWDLSVARQLRTGDEIEFRYFSVDQFTALANVVTNPAGGLLRIQTDPPTFDPHVQSIAARYESQLENFELNLRRSWGESCTLLGGLRYLEVDEQFHADLTTPAPTFTYDTVTRNRLYGIQFGAEAPLWCAGKLAVDTSVKGGLFANAGGHTTVHDTTVVINSAIDAAGHAAFVGECGVVGRYSLTDCLSARLGYQLLWIESAALASEQIPTTDFGAGRGINVDGSAFYHGAFVGFELLR